MPTLYIPVGPHVVEVSSPDAPLDPVAFVFPDSTRTRPATDPIGCIHVQQAGEDVWILSSKDMPDTAPQQQVEVFPALAERCWAICAAHSQDTEVLLNCNAVGWGETAILLVGSAQGGTSFLTSWMIEQGFSFISDSKLLLSGAGKVRVSGLAGPISVDAAAAGKLARLPSFEASTAIKVGGHRLFVADPTWMAPTDSAEPALIVFVNFDTAEKQKTAFVSADDAYGKMAQISAELSTQQAQTLRALTAETPALDLTYNAFGEIENFMDQLALYAAETRPDPQTFKGFLSHMRSGPSAPEPKIYDIPAPTERDLTAKLTIGMATFDDYDGVYFSIQSIRLYHPEILDHVEFLVIDNHPDGPCAEELKKLETSIPNYRYIPEKDIRGTAVRNFVFEKAAGEFVLCMDCHVLFEPGSLARLLQYFDENPQTQDLLQGPLIRDSLDDNTYTMFEPVWRKGMYGKFGGSNPPPARDDPPFDIPMQGLGVFACRRDCWPGFNGKFRGFGGEEGYIHQKFRNLGRRTLCLPFFRWLHRFGRPLGIPYTISWEDRIRNYWIGWNEVGLPIEPMKDHFAELVGIEKVEKVIADTKASDD